MFTRDAQVAFEDAISQGILTEETVGDYMYMYSTDDGDWFKHIVTREYVKSAA